MGNDTLEETAEPRVDGKRQGVLWGFGGALLASVCCVGPVVALAFGLGSASFLVGISAYRPYFLGASAVFTSAGVLLMLRRSRQCCSVNEHRRNMWLYPGIALATFVFGYGLLSYVLPAVVYSGSDGANPAHLYDETDQSTELQLPQLRLATLAVDGMT